MQNEDLSMQHLGQVARKFGWLLWIVLVASACGSTTTGNATGNADSTLDVSEEVETEADLAADALAEEETTVPQETPAPETVPAETPPPATLPAATRQPSADSEGAETTTQAERLEPADQDPFVCSNPCNVAIEGDSLTRGLVDRLCNQVADLGNCHNSGVSGDRTDQMLASAPTDVDTQLGAGSDDLLFLWAGTNDLWQRAHGGDPTTNAEGTAVNIETYISERRAAGWDHIVLVNLPPMMAAVEGVDELNSLIEAIDADAHIDLNGDPLVALGNANGFRDPDGVHFSREGYNYVMDTYYIPTVLELRG